MKSHEACETGEVLAKEARGHSRKEMYCPQDNLSRFRVQMKLGGVEPMKERNRQQGSQSTG